MKKPEPTRTTQTSAQEADGRDFFIYRDQSGTPAVVDTLSRVPNSAKKSLRVVTLPRHEHEEAIFDLSALEKILESPQNIANEIATSSRRQNRAETHAPGTATGLDPTSILLGAAVGFGVGVVMARIFRAPGWVIKVGLLVVAATLGSGAYLGWIRSRAGVGHGETIVHPGTFVEDARRARELLERQYTEQEKVLDEIE